MLSRKAEVVFKLPPLAECSRGIDPGGICSALSGMGTLLSHKVTADPVSNRALTSALPIRMMAVGRDDSLGLMHEVRAVRHVMINWGMRLPRTIPPSRFPIGCPIGWSNHSLGDIQARCHKFHCVVGILTHARRG